MKQSPFGAMGLAVLAGWLMASLVQAEPVLYVANYGNNTISQVTMSGSTSTYLTGPHLDHPFGLAMNATRTQLVVSNLVQGDPGLAYVTGFGSDPFVQYGMNTPRGVVFDSNGALFIADGDAHIVYLSDANGPHTYTEFISNPYAMAIDAQNNLYLTSPSQKIVIKITPGPYPVPEGNLSVYAQSDLLGFATGLAFGSDGSLYATSQLNQAIVKIAPGGGENSVTEFYANGNYLPVALTLDDQDNVYFTDAMNQQVIKVTQEGVASVFATGFSQPTGILFVVPEPGTIGLLALGGILFLRRRR